MELEQTVRLCFWRNTILVSKMSYTVGSEFRYLARLRRLLIRVGELEQRHPAPGGPEERQPDRQTSEQSRRYGDVGYPAMAAGDEQPPVFIIAIRCSGAGPFVMLTMASSLYFPITASMPSCRVSRMQRGAGLQILGIGERTFSSDCTNNSCSKYGICVRAAFR